MQVRNWRNPEFGAADAWYRYLDGDGWNLRRTNLPGRIRRAKQPFRAYPMVTPEASPPNAPPTEIKRAKTPARLQAMKSVAEPQETSLEITAPTDAAAPRAGR